MRAPRRRRGEPERPAPGRGCRAGRRCCCRCGSGRRSPSGTPGRGRAHDHRGCGTEPCSEELQRGGLAANLVERVVQVGQVLDLGDRQQADVRRALGDPQDRGLVEQRVEDSTRAEPLLQPLGDVVDTALAADVLAEQDDLRSPAHLVGKGGVQASRQCPCIGELCVLGERPAVQLEAGRRGEERGCRARRDPSRVVGRHRGDHLLGRLEAWPMGGLLGRGHDPLAGIVDQPEQLVRGRGARFGDRGVARCAGADRATRSRRSPRRTDTTARRRCRRGPTAAPCADAGRRGVAHRARSGRPRRRCPTPRRSRRRPGRSGGAPGCRSSRRSSPRGSAR